jgi:hypothetical protein
MTIPDRPNAAWMSTLADADLLAAESELHASFRVHEVAEKARARGRYVLLEGPPALVTAWLRWLTVSNETRARRLAVRRVPGAEPVS